MADEKLLEALSRAFVSDQPLVPPDDIADRISIDVGRFELLHVDTVKVNEDLDPLPGSGCRLCLHSETRYWDDAINAQHTSTSPS